MSFDTNPRDEEPADKEEYEKWEQAQSIEVIIDGHGQFTTSPTQETAWRCKCGIGGSQGTTHREHLVSVFAKRDAERERLARLGEARLWRQSYSNALYVYGPGDVRLNIERWRDFKLARIAELGGGPKNDPHS